MPGVAEPQAAPLDDPFSLVGTVLENRYRIEAVVGEGGFGVVYRARHVGFDAPVAIKALKIPLGIGKKDREAFLESFNTEGRLLFELGKLHPGFRQVTEMGVVEREERVVPYLVQEWLDGHTLLVDLERRRALRLGGRALSEVLDLLDPIARALAVAHGHKVAHRDVKPANIFLAQRDGGTVAKLLDLGVAKVMSATGSAALRDPTKQGLAAFTMDYAAPEQWIRKYGATGPWTDVYALALVCVELLTDKRPLEGDDYAQLLGATIDPIRPSPRNRGASVSDAIEQLFLAALAINPKDRPKNAGEFWDELLVRLSPHGTERAAEPREPHAATFAQRQAAPGQQPQPWTQGSQQGATVPARAGELPFAGGIAARPPGQPQPTVPAQPTPEGLAQAARQVPQGHAPDAQGSYRHGQEARHPTAGGQPPALGNRRGGSAKWIVLGGSILLLGTILLVVGLNIAHRQAAETEATADPTLVAAPAPPSSASKTESRRPKAVVVPLCGLTAAPLRDAPGMDSEKTKQLPAGTEVELGQRVTTPKREGKRNPDPWYQVYLDPAAPPSGWMHGDVLQSDEANGSRVECNRCPTKSTLCNERCAVVGWIGTYEFSESCGRLASGDATGVNHVLRVFQKGEHLAAELDADGFQTLTRIQANARDCGADLAITFDRYGNEDQFKPARKPGEILLTLRNDSGVITTTWGTYKPNCTDEKAAVRFELEH